MKMCGGAEVEHIALLTLALDGGEVSLKFQPKYSHGKESWAPETV
jgi:hypothetical protein